MRKWAVQEIWDVRQSMPFSLLSTIERFRTNGALPGAVHHDNSGCCAGVLPVDRGGWRRQVRLLLGVDKTLSAKLRAGRLLDGLSGLRRNESSSDTQPAKKNRLTCDDAEHWQKGLSN